MLGDQALSVKMLRVMGLLEASYDAVVKLRSAEGDAIHKLSDVDDELLAWFRKEGWI